MVVDKKMQKKRAAEQVQAVQSILREWDPMGLAPRAMAPADEYDAYAPAIVSLISKGATLVELTDHLDGLRTPDTSVRVSTSTVATNIMSAVLHDSLSKTA